jgi:hypothetical protein
MDTPFIVPVVMFLSIAAMVILRGPIGKALADRMAGRRLEAPPREDGEQVTAELEEMRLRLTELENRVDFAERMLAKGRDADRVGPGR